MSGTTNRFDFFDIETLSNIDLCKILESQPTCATLEGNLFLFGDKSGYVTVFDRQLFEKTVSFEDLKEENQFQRFKVFRGEVKHLAYIITRSKTRYRDQQHYVVILGDDSNTTSSIEEEKSPTTNLIKIFSVHDMSQPLDILNVTAGSPNTILTSFAILSDGSQISVGFSTGTVLLFSGPFVYSNQQPTTSLRCTPSILHKAHPYPVSSLIFCELPSVSVVSGSGSDRDRKIHLFVAFDDRLRVKNQDLSSDDNDNSNKDNHDNHSNNRADNNTNNNESVKDESDSGIIIFDTSMIWHNSPLPMHANDGMYLPAPNRNPPKVLDERGASSSCCSYIKNTCEFVVGRNDAIYNYSIDDRGGAMANFGEKLSICSAGGYVIVVRLEEKPDLAGGSSSSRTKRTMVNVFDTKNKLNCGTMRKHQLAPNTTIIFTIHDNSSNNVNETYLVTSNYSLIRFREKKTSQKLEILLQECNPPAYSTAIILAAEEQYDPMEIMKLYQRYGDYLYSRNEFDAAIIQYCFTIGYTPPSYVVMKFLDPNRLGNLVHYLEQLKAKGLVSVEHINLMLNCYIKSKDETKIKDLLADVYTIAQPSSEGKADNSNLNGPPVFTDSFESFDADQLIPTLLHGGYINYAFQVALYFYHHKSCLSIQLLSRANPMYDDALGYLAFISFWVPCEVLLDIIKKFGDLV